MVKLEWLKIHQFRWVKPGTELHFGPGINAIIGRNGTGKTTLLELLGAVWSGDINRYRNEPIDIELFFASDSGSFKLHVQNYAHEVDEEGGSLLAAADRPGSESDDGRAGDNLDAYNRQLRPTLLAALASRGRPELLDHVLLVMPYYSIEAWLFQNTAALRALADRHRWGAADRETIADWEADPALLDELTRPKEALACKDRHNAHLAETLPTRRLQRAGKSYAAAAARLRQCQPLADALARSSHGEPAPT